MYELTVTTHFKEEKTWKFIDYLYAEEMYEIAKTCVDCANAILLDAMSGEVIVEWDYLTGERNWDC